MFPFNLYNSRVTYLPPPGYAPLFPTGSPLHCSSMLGDIFADPNDQRPLCNYVDDDGMHRVYIFDSDFCPQNGSAVLRRCLLNVFLSSCKNKRPEVKEEVSQDGSTTTADSDEDDDDKPPPQFGPGPAALGDGLHQNVVSSFPTRPSRSGDFDIRSFSLMPLPSPPPPPPSTVAGPSSR